MNQRIVLTVVLGFLLIGALMVILNVQVVKGSGTIYIRADGSIDPPTANITSADNVTYSLIGNVNDSVVVQRADIVLDGAGYTVQGEGSGIGISVAGVSNVTIKNCIVKNWQTGVYYDIGANNGRIQDNKIRDRLGSSTENVTGICLKSNYNMVSNNTISNLTGGTGQSGWPAGSGGTSSGIYLSGSTGNTLTSNNIATLTGGIGGADIGWGGSAGSGGTSSGIYLSGSTGNTLTSNNITGLTGGTGGTAVGQFGSGGSGGTSAGIYLSGSTGNTLTSNNITGLMGGRGGAGGPSDGSSGPSGTSAAIWLDTASYDNRITALVAQFSYMVPDDSKLNTIEGKPILYFYGETSLKVADFNLTTEIAPILIGGSSATGNATGNPGGTGGISTGLVLINVANSVIENNTILGFKGMPGGTGLGYQVSGGSGGASSGIYLSGSTGNNLTSNTIEALNGGTGGTGGMGGQGGPGGSGGASSGIYLSGSTGNTLTSNNITGLTGGTGGTAGCGAGSGGSGGASSGIYLSGSTGNTLTSNNITGLTGGTGGTGYISGPRGTSYSLYLFQSNSTTIEQNSMNTVDYGLYLYSSNYNSIYHNNFLANASRISIQNSNNTWDNGYPIGGNYWSNYTGIDNYSGPYQNETGSDAVGDTPLRIDQHNNDDYPLMGPWPRHEIALVNVTLSTLEVYAGQAVSINVTTRNWGDLTESFNITAYYDNAIIGTQEIPSLASRAETTLTFSWNTTDVAGGYYTISANASVISGEIHAANNAYIDGTVRITSPVRIVQVVPCNQTGYSKGTFQPGTLAYFKVTVNSTATILQNTLITVNLYDNAAITIGVVSIQGPTWPGTSTIIFGLPIPATATIGTATIYACAYTDWPSQGGLPHCPEVSATLEITEP